MPNSLTSRVIQIQQYGGAEAMQLQSVQVPAPAAGEVRVAHKAIGLNYIDVYFRTGLYPSTLPLTLGQEAAGVVESVGAGVTHLQVGDRVAYVASTPGSYTDYRTLTADRVFKLPDAISFETAAGMMLKGLTAQYLLRRVRGQHDVVAGDYVLLHAAAGGVGLIVCQWAKALGLRVIATAGSAQKCDLAVQHGAHVAINYREENIAQRVKEITNGQGVKVVYDSVGKDTFEASLASLMPFGLLVSFGNASGPVPPVAPLQLAQAGCAYLTRQSLFMHLNAGAEVAQSMVQDVFEVVTSGKVHIRIDQQFALEDAQQAHQTLEARKTTGSTILLP